MRNVALLTLLTLSLALPAVADERHQSFISYDDGGTVVRTDEGKEIEGTRNLPIYAGDQLITARRGRTEVRLSDGNVIGIDRTTALTFRSILDNYDGEDEETVIELKYGKVAVNRTDLGHDHVRLDTENASYVAEREAIYSVETDSRGNDRVLVFDGIVEVRTPTRATRLRTGESATVDDKGPYDLASDQGGTADEFERWFLQRSERLDERSTKYVDRRLSYWADDLDEYGTWVNVSGIGWSWRPYVAAGWRPYYHGYWYHNRNGCLTWVSYDPWGWGTYHYGRWAYDPGFGWVWVPGYAYSPAWVYWWYGSNYIGWAPAGWWDCHRGYYDWAYRPYRNRDFGFGFYGRVRVNDMDLRPWTFLDSRTIVSNRADRAALTTDAIKQRLGRNGDGYATIGGGAARWTNEDFPDPAGAIRRRGIDGRVTGRETSGVPPTDVTAFFRRDPNVGATVRDRIVGSRGGGGTTVVTTTPVRIGGGGVAPIDGSSSVAPIGRGGLAPIDRGDRGSVNSGGTAPVTPSAGTTPSTPSRGTSGRTSGSWRDRGSDRGAGAVSRDPGATPPSTPAETERPRSDSWRGRIRTDDESSSGKSAPRDTTTSSDVPRRVIDRIGGARIYPRNSNEGSSSGSRDTSSRRSRDSEVSRPSRSGDSGSSVRSSDSGRSRDTGSSSSRSSGSSNSGSSNRGSSSSGSTSGSSNHGSSNSSGHRDSGGNIKRDH
jgi:hypothetical protein